MCIRDRLGVKSILLYFQQFGITPTVAFKVYKFWGLKAYDILRLNPYRLCEIPGVGFELAYAVAAKMNYDMSSKNRMQSAILYVLTYNLQNNGHTFLPKSKLSATAATLLETDADTAMENICLLYTSYMFV